jgi:hypothetical protein
MTMSTSAIVGHWPLAAARGPAARIACAPRGYVRHTGVRPALEARSGTAATAGGAIPGARDEQNKSIRTGCAWPTST